jgi:hypothetical protein
MIAWCRLRLKDQIIMFNSLVEKQMAMMQKLHTTWLQVRGFCTYLCMQPVGVSP